MGCGFIYGRQEEGKERRSKLIDVVFLIDHCFQSAQTPFMLHSECANTIHVAESLLCFDFIDHICCLPDKEKSKTVSSKTQRLKVFGFLSLSLWLHSFGKG